MRESVKHLAGMFGLKRYMAHPYYIEFFVLGKRTAAPILLFKFVYHPKKLIRTLFN